MVVSLSFLQQQKRREGKYIPCMYHAEVPVGGGGGGGGERGVSCFHRKFEAKLVFSEGWQRGVGEGQTRNSSICLPLNNATAL